MQSGIGELVFDVIQDQDGGFVAECLSESIVTEADTWQELRANVKEQFQPTSLMVPLLNGFDSTSFGTKSSPYHEATQGHRARPLTCPT